MKQMTERAQKRAKKITATIALGSGLITLGLAMVVVSLLFHVSSFAMILTWVMFFSTGIGGWLLGRGTKRQ